MKLISLTYFQLRDGFGWNGDIEEVQRNPKKYDIPTHIEVENHKDLFWGELHVHNNHLSGSPFTFADRNPFVELVGQWRITYKPIGQWIIEEKR